jgi:hypothetical protein
VYHNAVYILEYLGHANLGTTAFDKIKEEYGEVASSNDEEDGVNDNNKKKSLTVREKLIKNLDKIISKAKTNDKAPSLGIPSFLPGDIGNKISNIQTQEMADNKPVSSSISFKGVTMDELNNHIGSSIGLEWHKRGSIYRIWVGTQQLGQTNYEVRIAFHGFVKEVTYTYSDMGIDVKLDIADYYTGYLKRIRTDRIWNNAKSFLGLLKEISKQLTTYEDKTWLEFSISDKTLKDSIEDLTGKNGENEDTEKFYNSIVADLNSWFAERKGNYLTQDLLNRLLISFGGIKAKWFVTTNGTLFFGVVPNPKGIAPKKVFKYKAKYETPYAIEEYYDRDIFESISVKEIQKIPAPKQDGFIQEIDVSSNGEPAATGVSEEKPVNSNLGTQADVDTNNSYSKEDNTGYSVAVDLKGGALNSDVVTELNNNILSESAIILDISGCIADASLQLLDTVRVEALPDHTGNYLVIGIERTFSTGSIPKMDIVCVKEYDFEKVLAEKLKNTLEEIEISYNSSGNITPTGQEKSITSINSTESKVNDKKAEAEQITDKEEE